MKAEDTWALKSDPEHEIMVGAVPALIMRRITNSRDLSSNRMSFESKRLNDVFRDEGAFQTMVDESSN